MSLTRNLSPGGKLGLARGESRDPIGFAVAALSRVAQSDLIDRIGLRKQAEQAVFTVTRERLPDDDHRGAHLRPLRLGGRRRASASRRPRDRASST